MQLTMPLVVTCAMLYLVVVIHGQICISSCTNGSACGDGVNMRTNYMIKFTFDEVQGLQGPDVMNISLGFITNRKQGILVQLRDEANTESFSLQMNNNGGLKLFLDVGFERYELNTHHPNVDLTNDQAHEVILRRENNGRDIYLQVDNYTTTGQLGEAVSDSILDNPKYLYIGSNDTTNGGRGFKGCIYRMQIDNIFPLKRACQDPPLDYIKLEPAGDTVRKDMCGFQDLTHAPDPTEVLTRDHTNVNRTTPSPVNKSGEHQLSIGVTLASVLLVFIII